MILTLMNSALKRRLGFVFALALVANADLTLAQTTPVRRIQENSSGFRNEIVTVEGKVTRHVDEGRTSFPFYLEDNFASAIRVVGTTPQPPVDSRWQVTGLVALDAAGDPYIIEQRRALVSGVSVSATGAADSAPALPPDTDSDGVPDASDACAGTMLGAQIDPSGCEVKDRTLLYVGAGVGALLIFGGLGWYLVSSRREAERARLEDERKKREEDERRKRDEEAARKREEEERNNKRGGGGAGAGGGGGVGDDIYDGATMRFVRPIDADGTIKLLPGRLQVIAGADKGQEIRLVRSGGGVPELTFGRSDGPRFTHIQLRAPTVSRRHALMRFESNGWVIANFSETNPVVLNGNAMNAVGTPTTLKDGDTFELGEVGFRFLGK